MALLWEEYNPTGSRVMVLLGGGWLDDSGVTIQPMADHPDYTQFINRLVYDDYRILCLSGYDILPAYYDALNVITASLVHPTLVGHSAGALVGLNWLKHRDDPTVKAWLFNCPLIYPWVSPLDLRYCYRNTEWVTIETRLIMSTKDPIMSWVDPQASMTQAIDEVRMAGKVRVDIMNRTGYEHSPFSPVPVAYELMSGIRQ